MLRISSLIDRPIKGAFDFLHLQETHKYIFQDIYLWAGQLRKVDIAKGTMFCKVQFLENQADTIFRSLRNDNYLKNLEPETMIKKAAYYLSEINALHPFREGNGRSQREFVRLLLLSAGYRLDFSNVSAVQILEASKDSFMCDYAKMEKLFKISIEEL